MQFDAIDMNLWLRFMSRVSSFHFPTEEMVSVD